METNIRKRRRRRVVIYCRISDDREGRRWGVDRQEKVCRERAEENGWTVVAVLIENDVSAYSGAKRPEYLRLLNMLETGFADAVLALSGKRLQRNYREAFTFLDLVEAQDIEVDTIKAGAYNLNTAEGRGRARRAAVDAQEESEEIGERVRDAKRDNVARGEYRGGPRPFGYEADGVTPRALSCPGCAGLEGFTVDRECRACGAAAVNTEGSEAWWTEWATDEVLASRSLNSAVTRMERAKVRTVPRRKRNPDGSRSEPQDAPFEYTVLRKLLLRPRNAGLMEVDGEIVGRANWAPIVPEEKWRACKAILTAPERRTTTGNARKWLGSGLYRCGVLVGRYTTFDGIEFVHTGAFNPEGWALYLPVGETGAPTLTAEQLRDAHGKLKGTGTEAVPEGRRGCPETMLVSTSGRGTGKAHYPAYRCRAASHLTRRPEALDEFVQQVVVARLSRPDAVQLLAPPVPGDARDLPAEANALRAKLDGYVSDYDGDLITRQQMIDGTARTRAKLAEVERQMAERLAPPVLHGVPLGTPGLAEAWKDYDRDRKATVIDALMTITLLPARRGRPAGFVPGSGAGYFDRESVRIEWRPAD